MDDVAMLLEALADAARSDSKREFDRLERELLTKFEGSFDAMPADVYEKYLEVDRLWPVVAPASVGSSAPPAGIARNLVQVSLTAEDEAWLRQIGVETDRSFSAVLEASLSVIRDDNGLAAAVTARLARPRRSD